MEIYTFLFSIAYIGYSSLKKVKRKFAAYISMRTLHEFRTKKGYHDIINSNINKFKLVKRFAKALPVFTILTRKLSQMFIK